MDADVIGHTATRVFAALLSVYGSDGRATVRDVADEAGVCVHTAHKHLKCLRAEGLVAFESHRAGTLRPLYGPVTR